MIEVEEDEQEPVGWTDAMKSDLRDIEEAFTKASVHVDRLAQNWLGNPIKASIAGVQQAVFALSKVILYSGVLDEDEEASA